MKPIYIFTLMLLSSCLSAQKDPTTIAYQTLEHIDGTSISADTLKGKILVVNFWATWCRPCLNEIPDLNQLVFDNKGNQHVLFLAIAPSKKDDFSKVSAFLERVPFFFEHLAPKSGTVFYPSLDELRYPTTLIFDESGILQKEFVGTLTQKELKMIRSICRRDKS